MKNVQFVQFLRPDARREIVEISLHDDCALKAIEIRALGCQLTAEVLMTGECSFAVEAPDDLGDFDVEICTNGPDVPIKISEMLRRFDPNS